MIYTARPINAKEAHRIGLVNRVYSLAEIDEKVDKIAKGLCKNSQRAIKESKYLIQHGIYTNPVGFEQEEIKFQEDFASGEPKERLTKVIEEIQRKSSKTQ